MSLLISSALAASSAAAAASASAAAFCAWASAWAWASSGFTGATAAGAAGVDSGCWGASLSWAGAVAAEDTGLSWSENMFNRLRDVYPCFLSSQSLLIPNRGVARRGYNGAERTSTCFEVTRSLTTESCKRRVERYSPKRIPAARSSCQSRPEERRCHLVPVF